MLWMRPFATFFLFYSRWWQFFFYLLLAWIRCPHPRRYADLANAIQVNIAFINRMIWSNNGSKWPRPKLCVSKRAILKWIYNLQEEEKMLKQQQWQRYTERIFQRIHKHTMHNVISIYKSYNEVTCCIILNVIYCNEIVLSHYSIWFSFWVGVSSAMCVCVCFATILATWPSSVCARSALYPRHFRRCTLSLCSSTFWVCTAQRHMQEKTIHLIIIII